MWDEVIKLAMSNGIWAVLFCLLLFYELRDSRKREAKYNQTIAVLTEAVLCVKSLGQAISGMDTKLDELMISLQKRDGKKTLEKKAV